MINYWLHHSSCRQAEHRWPARLATLGAALLILATLPAMAVDNNCGSPIPPFEFRYTLSEDGKQRGHAVATMTATPTGWRYHFISRGRFGIIPVSIEEESRFRWVDAAPQPEHYQRQSRGGPFRRTSTANFFWQDGLADGEHKSEDWQLELEGGELDRLVLHLATAMALNNGADMLDFDYVDRGELRQFRSAAHRVEISTAAGTYQAVRVDRVRGDRATRVWHAAELSFLPVRIEHDDDDEVWVMELESMRWLDCGS